VACVILPTMSRCAAHRRPKHTVSPRSAPIDTVYLPDYWGRRWCQRVPDFISLMGAVRYGLGRIVLSEKEVPIILPNMVSRDRHRIVRLTTLLSIIPDL
jgi:hypothetical protein